MEQGSTGTFVRNGKHERSEVWANWPLPAMPHPTHRHRQLRRSLPTILESSGASADEDIHCLTAALSSSVSQRRMIEADGQLDDTWS